MDIVTWLGRRKDIDTKRIFLISHDDGSAVALTAAGLGRGKVRGVALIGASGVTGRETVLEQQQELLNRLHTPPSERDARIALQRRVLDAVVTGKGWESVPADLRRQTDTVWFRSWLMFDPAVAIKKLNQPLLIVHGSLDRETLPSNGDRLARMGTARKVPPAATSKMVVPGVNHLLLAAETGSPDEYDSLPAQTISPELIAAVITWLNLNGK
jgi:pimeloyl-ACP methyl ester carboxylesterase